MARCHVFLAFFLAAYQHAAEGFRHIKKEGQITADATQASNPFWPTGCVSDRVLETEVSYNGRTFVELKFTHRGRCRVGLVASAPPQASNRPAVYMFHGSGRPSKAAVQMASGGGGCSRFDGSEYLCVWVQSDEDIVDGERTGVMGWESYDEERTPNRGDVDFVRSLHEKVLERWALDSDNVFAFGHSSGSTFVMGRLLFEANDLFRAVVASAGRLWPSMPFFPNRAQWNSCCHTMYNYGGADPRGWGENVHARFGPNYAIEASALRLAEANSCRFSASGSGETSRTFQTSNPQHTVSRDSMGGSPVTRYVFPSCSNGQLVEMLNYTNLGHGCGNVCDAFNENMRSFFEDVRQSSACRDASSRAPARGTSL